MFWPSTYTAVVTTADGMHLASAVVVAVAGILELRRISAERATMLAAEQEHTRRLRELAVLKADFTAMVAHELGSPVAAIRGYTEMLATGELGPAQQRDALATIRHQADALAALVSDVRTSAAEEREDFAVRLRPAALRPLLLDAVAFAETLPQRHVYVVEADRETVVLADPERIGQVLRNLLSNAAKYSPEGTPIELRATLDGRKVCVEVIDRGDGIDRRDIRRIFEKFGRGQDARRQNVPGLGLGLYLSRRLVQAHGSELSVRSTSGVGSVFALELEVLA